MIYDTSGMRYDTSGMRYDTSRMIYDISRMRYDTSGYDISGIKSIFLEGQVRPGLARPGQASRDSFPG
jgi:hypothetical protein